jgi:hypothetical protein
MATVTLAAGVLLAAARMSEAQDAAKDDGAAKMPTADEIVRRANHTAYYQGGNGSARVTMSIYDAEGNKRTRELTILRRNWPDEDEVDDEMFTGDQRFYVYFYRPPDVNKMSFLVWKHPQPGKNDDRWLYVPDLNLVRRISSTDKRTSFVGSHYYYEDVSGRSPQLDTHELLADESTGKYYVLKSTPKDIEANKTVKFASYKTWVHKDTYLPIQTSYYDEDGTEYRRYQVRAANVVKTDAQGNEVSYPTATASRMKDLKTGGYTDLEYTDVEYNLADLVKSVFEQRSLKNPPREHLD